MLEFAGNRGLCRTNLLVELALAGNFEFSDKKCSLKLESVLKKFASLKFGSQESIGVQRCTKAKNLTI